MNIETRLEKLERKIMPGAVIPEQERLIVIAARTDEEFETIKQERFEELRKKYGVNVSEEEMLIIFVKKFT